MVHFRVATLTGTALLEENSEINFPVLVALGGWTLAALVVVIGSKICRPKNATALARQVFVNEGTLSRPQVLGSRQYEEILRGWLSARQVAILVLLEVVTKSPFLALLFRFSHEAVFTRADKGVLCYTAILMTFLYVCA